MKKLPTVFAAFANGDPNSLEHLPHLDKERITIENVLDRAETCEVITRTEVTIGRVKAIFNKYKGAIHVFHFSGHASAQGLSVKTEGGKNKKALVEGLAGFIGGRKSVQLVFLNGCSTRAQVRKYADKGVPVVIATKRPVKDEVAALFSKAFYESMVSGHTIEQAFSDAEDSLQMVFKPNDLYQRGLVAEELEWIDPERPYEIHCDRKNMAVLDEGFKDWIEESDEEEAENIPEGTSLISKEIDAAGFKSPQLALLCDRAKENTTFSNHIEVLAPSVSIPMNKKLRIVLIHGTEEEVPEKLADRFEIFTSPDILDLHIGDESEIYRKQVDFPQTEDFDPDQDQLPWRRLNRFLKKALHPAKKEISANDLLSKYSKYKLLAIQHHIMAESWDPRHPEFLEEYIRDFWQVDFGPKDPTVIVQFVIVYAEKRNFMARLLNSSTSKIEKTLVDLANTYEEVVLLRKLKSLKKKDVSSWRIKHLRSEYDLADHIFKGKGLQPMKYVLRELELAIDRYNESLSG